MSKMQKYQKKNVSEDLKSVTLNIRAKSMIAYVQLQNLVVLNRWPMAREKGRILKPESSEEYNPLI